MNEEIKEVVSKILSKEKATTAVTGAVVPVQKSTLSDFFLPLTY